MEIIREKRRQKKSFPQLQRMINLDQNATMTKPGLSLTTSHLIISSGKVLTLFHYVEMESCAHTVLFSFQTNMGR